MKAKTLLGIAAVAGAAAVGASIFRAIGIPTGVQLTGKGCFGILTRDDKPVAVFASTGIQPHTVAGMTAHTCAWIAAASGKRAIAQKLAQASAPRQ